MGRDRDAQFEWVNAWAAVSRTPGDNVAADAPAVADGTTPEPLIALQVEPAAPPVIDATTEPASPLRSEPAGVVAPEAVQPTVARFVAARSEVAAVVPLPVSSATSPVPPADQLMRDIAEIERARDALAAAPASGRRTKAFMLVPTRGPDSVPLLVGGVLALVMLMVFGAAATMTKFGR